MTALHPPGMAVTANAATLSGAVAPDGWFPLERSAHVQGAQVVKAFLQGQELALWRASTGTVQAWENRCPHRSVRLTLGFVVEDTLVCRYHGWRYRTDGRCSGVPSTPTLAPPPTACARSFMCREADGVIWASLSLTPRGYPPSVSGLVSCRSFTLAAGLGAVGHGLAEAGFHTDATSPVVWRESVGGAEATTLLLVPQDDHTTLAHLFVAASHVMKPGVMDISTTEVTPDMTERRVSASHRIKALLSAIVVLFGASPHVA